MGVPSTWGSTVGSYGRIGLSFVEVESTAMTYKFYYEVWIWTKYSCSDTGNTLYANYSTSASSATTSRGSVNVNTTVASGDGWSTSNQKKLYTSETIEVTRGTSSKQYNAYAKLVNVDRVGGTMYANRTITIAAKTSYSVKYNNNGGSGAPSAQTKWHGTALTLSGTKPTRTGYTFVKWNTKADGSGTSYNSGASYTANAAVTLYAVWKANTYPVKYNSNGGSGAPAAQTKTHDATLKLSTTIPTLANHTFKGWATSASGSVVYAAGANYTKNAAVTLYAVYELNYTKPKISSFSITRCDSAGNASDSGTYALVKFKYSCSAAVSSIKIQWKLETATSFTGSKSVSTSTTSVSEIVGGSFSAEESYSFLVTVTDASGSTERPGSISGQNYYIDFLADDYGTAIGKPAEFTEVFDVAWLTRIRQHLCVGEKTGHLDGKQGVLLSNEGYIQLQRTTAQNYNPYIAFLRDDETEVTTQIQLDVDTNRLKLLGASAVQVGPTLYTQKVLSERSDLAFEHVHPTSGTSVSFGVGSGGTNHGIYNEQLAKWLFKCDGNDIFLGCSKADYRPYKRQGDVLDVQIYTSGYVTNNGKDVYFFIPFSVPIVGAPTATVASGDGLTIRQAGKYTHGSSADASVKPASYTVYRYMWHGISVKATFNTTTNAVNNDACGIRFDGTITLS